MGKKLQVMVIFEFDGISDPDSPEADMVIEGVTRRTAWWNGETGATSVWVQDATVVEDDDDLNQPLQAGFQSGGNKA